MPAQLADLQAFQLTFELGNFTRAARALGVTPQAASRAVARLEEELGSPLFRRNTRHVEPTEAGRLYHQATTEALSTLAAAESALQARRFEPSGVVRVSVPTTYGHHRFLPQLAEFTRLHPRVEVDVDISNHNIDFVREGYDLAIRMGDLGDASFVARPLGDFTLGLFGSPGYLDAAGRPQTLRDLADHRCAVFILPSTGRELPWAFFPGPELLHPAAAVRLRTDVLGLISFARAGGGLVQTYHFLVERELARGELEEVLTAHAGFTRPFSLIYPRAVLARPAVRALVDFLTAQGPEDRPGAAR